MNVRLKIFAIIISVTLLMCGLFYYNYNKIVEVEELLNPLQESERAVVFAAYSNDGSVSDYVITYLKNLKKVANNIIYITDNPIKKSEIKKLKPYVNYLQAKKHYEYDWGSYKQGYFYLKEQNRLPTEQLIFANDSVIGPLQDINTLFYTMNSRNNDFWGITANIDIQYHIQSYFLVFNKNVFDDTNFANFLIKVKQQEESWDVVFKYEVPFTKYLEDLGYVSDVFIDYEALSFLPLNDKNCYPLTILSQYKMPFLKLRTFTNRLTVQESRRLVFNWLKKHNPDNYKELILHLEKIKSPYLKEAR